MGGLISVLVCGLAAAAYYGTGRPVLFWLSVILAVAACWSWGVMHNYATESAKRRRDVILKNMRSNDYPEGEISRYSMQPLRFDDYDISQAPGWLAIGSMTATLVGVVLLLMGVALRYLGH